MVEDAPQKKKILVVDDEPVVVEYFRAILESAGYEVDVAHEGREAFRKTNRQCYDLVHIDIRMPNWDGLDCITSMQHVNPEIKVFVVSGVLTDDVLRELEEQPIVKGWIEKPVNPENYLRAIRTAIESE